MTAETERKRRELIEKHRQACEALRRTMERYPDTLMELVEKNDAGIARARIERARRAGAAYCADPDSNVIHLVPGGQHYRPPHHW